MKNTRNTKQKEEILKFLEENKGTHLMIDDIANGVSKSIGKTTIYRMINNLIEEGVVIKIPLNNKQGACYQYNSKNKECTGHYHLVCKKCGDLIHFKSENFEHTISEALQKEKFNIDTTQISFLGECQKCNQQKHQ